MEETFQVFYERYPKLKSYDKKIKEAYKVMEESYSKKNKLLICGNGGSASDSDHIVGELMKSFLFKRKIEESISVKLKNQFGDDGLFLAENLEGALPAIAVTQHTALNSAFLNDVSGELIYAQQVYGYGEQGDVLLGISTSGKAKNVLAAFKVAKVKDIKTIAITGSNPNPLSKLCDVIIQLPSNETTYIQEQTIPIYHLLCNLLEKHFFEQTN